MLTPVLSAETRRAALADMTREPLDILVIGGGVTGAGIALDAASRGLRVAVVEAQDWSAGTSSRSSKLVHGGLRYLAMFDFKMVAEALRERGLLLDRLAPHLVRPVPFLYPMTKRLVERPYVTAGVGLYDVMARIGARISLGSQAKQLPVQRHFTRAGVHRLSPDVKPEALVGAIRYFDASVDDARLVIDLIRTAVGYGALAASRTKVTALTKDVAGRVTGATLCDLETGDDLEVRAEQTICATGVWTEQTQELTGTAAGLKVLASKGIHITVPRDRIRGKTGFILQTEKSVLFIIPWSRYWVIGTTDTPYVQDLRHPVASRADIDYVLERANVILERPLTHDDVIGCWAGLRPLLQPGVKDGAKEGSTQSTKVSREHTVTSPTPGFVSIAGGKLTTYRVMAEDAVDFALGMRRAKALPSVTMDLPLVGAANLDATRRQTPKMAHRHCWDEARIEHLIHRYGSELDVFCKLIEDHPNLRLAEPLAAADAYVRAEVLFGVVYEGALHLEDLMVNRTRLTYEQKDRGMGAAVEMAELVAPFLGWDEARVAEEVAAYQSRCDAEAAAANSQSEAEAAEARDGHGDVTPM